MVSLIRIQLKPQLIDLARQEDMIVRSDISLQHVHDRLDHLQVEQPYSLRKVRP